MNKNQQKVVQIMEGTKVVHTSEGGILFRCPSEILKVLTKQKIAIPNVIFLPERDFEFGINQSSLEFPLYDFLFRQQGFSQGKRLVVICNNVRQVERQGEILRLTLLGPTREEMEEWEIPEAEIDYWLRISHHFALKNKKGNVAAIDEMVDFKIFDRNSEVEIGGIKICKMDKDVLKVVDGGEEILVDINLNERQKPPIPILIPDQLIQRPIFGVVALSRCTTGFDPRDSTSGWIQWFYGVGLSIDGPAWMKEHLYLRGINPNEILAHFITHPHEDHSDILDLIINGKRATILAAKVVAKMMFLKIALTLDIPLEQVEEMIDFIELPPGKEISWYGARFKTLKSIHSIPTTGVKISLGDRSIVYSGDTLWGEEELGALIEKGVLTQEEKDEAMNIPCLPSDLTFYDAGEGMIHPKPEKLAELPEIVRKRLIPTHLEQLPEGLEQFLNPPPKPGQEWIITPQDSQIEELLAFSGTSLLQDAYPNWRDVDLLGQGKIQEYPAKQIILEQGKPGKSFYILLNGTVEEIIDGEYVTYFSSGDFFGDFPLLEDIPCSETIKTLTPIKVLEIDKESFLEFSRSTGIEKRLRWIYHIRPALMKIDLFKGLPADKINWIAENTLEQEFGAGEIIVKQGEKGDAFYFNLKGEEWVEVISEHFIKRVAHLYLDQFFGEMAFLGDGFRTATIRSITSCKVGVIPGDFFKRMLKEIPSISYELRMIADERAKDTAQKIKREG